MTIVTDVTLGGKWPSARNPDRSWCHRHTSLKRFCLQPLWLHGQQGSGLFLWFWMYRIECFCVSVFFVNVMYCVISGKDSGTWDHRCSCQLNCLNLVELVSMLQFFSLYSLLALLTDEVHICLTKHKIRERKERTLTKNWKDHQRKGTKCISTCFTKQLTCQRRNNMYLNMS